MFAAEGLRGARHNNRTITGLASYANLKRPDVARAYGAEGLFQGRKRRMNVSKAGEGEQS